MKRVQGRTSNQKDYIRTIASHQIIICHGPAGTGKTYIAAGIAAEMFHKQKVDRIVVCRPVVSCGTDIGFLPGTVEDKIGPYLAPLFDELGKFFDKKQLRKCMEDGTIEIVPLSMMRGRTFNNSFVILDEAQNATLHEFKMLLTRIGTDSKMVLCGDESQADTEINAFQRVTRMVEPIKGVGVVQMGIDDIVRNGIIRDLLRVFHGK